LLGLLLATISLAIFFVLEISDRGLRGFFKFDGEHTYSLKAASADEK
jgi:hypothetical protein